MHVIPIHEVDEHEQIDQSMVSIRKDASFKTPDIQTHSKEKTK